MLFPQLICCGSIEARVETPALNLLELVSTTDLLWLHWSGWSVRVLVLCAAGFHNWFVVAPLKQDLVSSLDGCMCWVSTTDLLWLHWSLLPAILALLLADRFHNWFVVAPLKPCEYGECQEVSGHVSTTDLLWLHWSPFFGLPHIRYIISFHNWFVVAPLKQVCSYRTVSSIISFHNWIVVSPLKPLLEIHPSARADGVSTPFLITEDIRKIVENFATGEIIVAWKNLLILYWSDISSKDFGWSRHSPDKS